MTLGMKLLTLIAVGAVFTVAGWALGRGSAERIDCPCGPSCKCHAGGRNCGCALGDLPE